MQKAIQDGKYKKAIFEIHSANSLSNRFKALLPIHTEVCYHAIYLPFLAKKCGTGGVLS